MACFDIASLTGSDLESLAALLELWSEPEREWIARDGSELRAVCPSLARGMERWAAQEGWGRLDAPFHPAHAIAQFFARFPEAPVPEQEMSAILKSGFARLRLAWRACGWKFSHHLRLHREKLESLRQLAYGASHEINNPLANISTRAQTLLIDETHPERRNKLSAIVAQAFRAHEMIANLMLFARPPELQLDDFSIKAWLEKLQPEIESYTVPQQTELKIQAQPGTQLWRADAGQLSQLVAALVRNSSEALGSGGLVQVSIQPLRQSEPNDQSLTWWTISVSDNGPGFSTATLKHAFDPFFSGREAGRGLGFGLSKCWVIAQAHRGQIAIEAIDNKTRVTVALPIGLSAAQHSRSQ